MTRAKVVVLVDPYVKGHHQTYMKAFAECVLKEGYQVAVLMPQVEAIDQHIHSHVSEFASSYYSLSITDKEFKWPVPGLVNRYLGAFRRWLYIKRKISELSTMHQVQAGMVFFCWLDSYLFKYMPQWFIDKVWGYKWSGLYFQPNHIRLHTYPHGSGPEFNHRDSILRAASCQSIAILDRFIVEKMRERLKKDVVVFPDIANFDLPSQPNDLSQRMALLAGDRKIVGMIGLEKRKGLLQMIRLAKRVDTDRFFFAFIGEINMNEYEANEQNEIVDFFESCPVNVMTHFEYVWEETVFNSLFSKFHIPFVMYQHFLTSSNVLVKAAYFNKPVLATNQYCIGDTVKAFGLGVTADPQDVESQVIALQMLDSEYDRLVSDHAELRKKFVAENSKEMLTQAFRTILK